MIDQLGKLQELLEEAAKEKTKGVVRVAGKYSVSYALTELDCGFRITKELYDENVIFGASTDGVKTEIYPKGIIRANDKTGFNKFMKEWYSKMLEKRKEEIATILSEIPDAE